MSRTTAGRPRHPARCHSRRPRPRRRRTRPGPRRARAAAACSRRRPGCSARSCWPARARAPARKQGKLTNRSAGTVSAQAPTGNLWQNSGLLRASSGRVIQYAHGHACKARCLMCTHCAAGAPSHTSLPLAAARCGTLQAHPPATQTRAKGAPAPQPRAPAGWPARPAAPRAAPQRRSSCTRR
jgi:hypothetical protein